MALRSAGNSTGHPHDHAVLTSLAFPHYLLKIIPHVNGTARQTVARGQPALVQAVVGRR